MIGENFIENIIKVNVIHDIHIPRSMIEIYRVHHMNSDQI
jgi:hypothetical protein